MLEVVDLHAGYGDAPVLFGVGFGVARGEVVTLLGRNGMGKTTTVRAVMGLIRPRGGAVRFAGDRIDGMPPHRIARRGIGLVPEGRQVFPNLTTRENLIATAARAGGAWSLDRVLSLFPRLAERLDSMAALLSGGEQQMLAIGRALMTDPCLLILDEATEGLAPLIREDIWRALAQLKQAGLGILLIDKNLNALMRIADRHVVLEKGRAVWTGDSAALRADQALARRYLGV
ncbi:MAG: ABC transporter ATP-binding protein [Proteobacteria bacterium]|nr:ABC transporter ATP-binding protein [Pseudomonadota bacterium]